MTVSLALGGAGLGTMWGEQTVSAVTIPGTSLADSNALGNALERLMLESAEIDVRLEMMHRPREAVLEELRQKVPLLPETNVTIGQPISHRIDHMLSGTRANIAVKIFGDDLPTLRQLASQVQGQMSQVEGVVDLAAETFPHSRCAWIRQQRRVKDSNRGQSRKPCRRRV